MTNKEFYTKQLAKLNERKNTLTASIVESDSKEERAAIGETLKGIADEIAEVEQMLASIDEPAAASEDKDSEGRGIGVLSTMQTRTAASESEDYTESKEYRKAFQRYMATGKMEYRADESTATTDTNIGTVIPQNLVNKIIEKYEQVGVIYNLVTRTAYPVGQSIPVDSVKPTATWIGEGASSDAQKKTMASAISFTHHKLRCEIRYTEEVATMSLPAFEALFVKQVGEAMLKAQETAIVEGDGTGKPTGILSAVPDTGKAIEIATGDALDFAKLCEMEAAVPVEYESTAKWCMTKKTFMAFVGMVDQYGQPIARVNYGISGKPERTLLGRDVVIYAPQADSKLKNFGAALEANSVVAFIFDFADYVLNTNYDLGISHARDWDNEDHKTKAVLACDGKVIDKTSLVTLTVK